MRFELFSLYRIILYLWTINFPDAIQCNATPGDTEARIKYELICNNKYDKSHKDKNTTQITNNFIIRSFDFVSFSDNEDLVVNLTNSTINSQHFRMTTEFSS